MIKYRFSPSGRLLRQWWYCSSCDVYFWHWVEGCPSCMQTAEPKGGNDPGDKYFQLFENKPHRLTHSKTYQFGWDLTQITL